MTMSVRRDTTAPTRLAPMISIEGLSYRYRNAPAAALESIDLQVPAASTFGLLGPNGAGKTTLLSLLTGLREPQQGSIRIAGLDLIRDAVQIKQMSALVPQDFAFYLPLTGRENLRFFASVYGVTGPQLARRMDHCIAVCRLEEVLDRRAEHYSGGLKRRLNLAIGLLNAPRILYLDEPTVGVDARSRQTILAALNDLKSAGVTIIYTSHYMEEVQAICDYLSIIDHGCVLACDPMDAFLARATHPELHLILANAPSDDLVHAWGAWQPRAAGTYSWTLTTARGLEDVREILAVAQAQGVTIVQIQYGVTRLEQIYLRLIEGSESDARQGMSRRLSFPESTSA